MSSLALRTLTRRSVCRTGLLRHQTRCASDAPAPPLLLKMRGDMKEAMKTKDAARLSVLRAVMAEVLNASKTDKPIQTDVQLVHYLRKRTQASKDAAAGFQEGGRPDLVKKEEAQIAVLQGYASTIEEMTDKDITTILKDLVGQLQAEGGGLNVGKVLKVAFKKDGPFEGKAVDRSRVPDLVKGLL